MIGYFCQIDAVVGGVPTTVRLASHDDERLCHLGGFTWWPAIAALPQLRYDLFDGAFSGELTSPTGSMAVQIDALPVLPALALHGAGFKMWRGEIGSASNAYVPIFDGLIRAQPAIDNGVATIDIGVDDKWLDEPFLATYAGTGGAEGGIDLKGAVKPRLFGAPRFVEAVLVDPVDTIFQLHDGPMQGVELAFDQLSRFGAAKANVATFAQLKALSLSAGEWATCLAQGFVRLGAPPAGQVVFHAQGDNVAGWVRRTGAIVTRIAQIMGAGGKIATGTLSAIDTAIARNVSVAVTSQTTPRELIQRMAAAINCTAVVSWLGKLVIVPVGLGTPTTDLVSDGSALPPVRSVRQLAADPPFWRMAMTAAVTNRVHSFSEIAFTGTLTPTGDYDPARVYREGDMVTLLDKSSWLFIDTTPTANSYPSDSNPDWQKLDSAISATNITYADGATIQSLRPGEAGANQTETRVASAIAGQGGLATRGNVYFGSGYILEGAGGAQATLSAFKTALGTASGIVGQGPFATLAQLVFGSPLLSGFGSLAGLSSIFFGSPNLLESSGGAQATLVNFKTSSGTAAGIAGQGALATLSSLANGSQYLTGFGGLSGLSSIFFGSPQLLETSGGAQATLVNFKTSSGIASGIAGQSPWATSTLPVSFVTNQDANLVYDGGLSLKGARWTLGAGWVWSPGGYGEGPYFNRSVGGGSVSYSDFFLWGPDTSGYAQSDLFSGGMTAGDFRFDIEFFNGTAFLERSAQVGAPNGSGWTEVGTPFTSPSNCTRARFRFFHAAGAQNTNSAIRRIKVSRSTVRVPFTDEATNGGLYDDGTNIQALKPGEAGANVTEGRVAASIAGQGSLATRNNVVASQMLSGSPDSVIPDADFQDQSWWGNGGGVVAVVDMDGGWSIARRAVQFSPQNFDIYSKFFPVEPGASYKIRVRVWGNSAFSGWFQAFIHMPSYAWYSLKTGNSQTPGVSGDRWTGPFDTGNLEYIVKNPTGIGSNANRQWQFRFLGNWTGSNVIIQISITRVSALNELVTREDGTTRLTDNTAVTGLGTAAAISGQGAFATAPQIGSWNVNQYFNFSAFKLDYSITRADGTTVVTETMSLTALGISAGFSGQGSLATRNNVDTGTIAAGSVVVPYNQTAADITVSGGSTVIEMPGFFTVGDGAGGTAIIDFTCSTRSLTDDRQIVFNMLVDTGNGAGYQGVADTIVGTRSDSGVGTDFKLTAQIKKAISAAQVRVAINAQTQGYNNSGDSGGAGGSVVVRQPTLVITGGKR